MTLDAFLAYALRLAVALGVVWLGFLAYQQFNVSDTLTNISVMRTNIDKSYRGRSYATLNNDIIIRGELAPRSMIKNSSLVSPFGNVTVSGTSDSQYSILLDSLSRSACQDIAGYSPDSWQSILVNGENVLDASTSSVAVDIVVQACQTGKVNTVQFISH